MEIFAFQVTGYANSFFIGRDGKRHQILGYDIKYDGVDQVKWLTRIDTEANESYFYTDDEKIIIVP